jgi:hypothetical protein
VVVIALGVCSLFIVLVMMALGGVWFVFRRDIRLWRGAS